ncbi:hypothetical protein DL237_18865 [Pseudooceanicola sediminis]|uniref:SapC family protein n=1 Tax=Pseudooceanicola sediminis TaxID=2211117 RepID=A0A399IVU8_9RHOB|nr:SapC family protein [Pseudooceanicola sediminis]KAA2311691.1 SapC family protein [Puniceibacterium sp. HSS470]RII37144.1 hypothetical protein DL237_18865 [Pseudooceanicola sediminis]|tara:strand:- start:5046 stop:6005 length:960 start_codon:yes stop_codon:yes gene_type:complete
MNSADQTRSFAEDFFERFEPVSAQRHGTWSWQPFNSYGFARGYVSVPIVLAELNPVAGTLPILFEQIDSARGPQAGLRPVALLHLADPTARVVSDSGAWQAFYVPGALRIHPFACDLRPDSTPDSMPETLHLDPQSACLSPTPGPRGTGHGRLFDLTGTPTEAFHAIQSFFGHYQASLRSTLAASRALWQAGVLKPARMQDLPGPGYYTADRAALSRLSGPRLEELFRSEAVALALAQILSLQKIAQMKQRAGVPQPGSRAQGNTAQGDTAQDGMGQTAAQEAAQGSAQISGHPPALTPFLDAMARAYETDKDEIFFKT